jgi:NAD(P)-dependent dehydrogenase (short-subunit alcohol dehydrogenase family)
MPISIEGKKIIVTGGGRGIGSDTVRHFAEEGACVVSFDILDELGRQVAETATAKGPGTVSFRHVDVANEEEVQANVTAAVAELGGLDAIVNIAGITMAILPEEMTATAWDRLLAINVKGLAHMCQAAFPHLKDGGGSIVNFGSDVGLMNTPPVSTAYGATKGAVISYTRLLAGSWGAYRIRANVVNPLINTPMNEEFQKSLDPAQRKAFEEHLKATVPLGGTLGDGPTDLAPVVAFLVSDASKFVTAQIIGVNGGLASGR